MFRQSVPQKGNDRLKKARQQRVGKTRKQEKSNPMARIDLDRIPDVSSLRVIEIDSIDVCPCAGTHVESTGVIPRVALDRVKSKGAGKLRVSYQFE